MTRFTLKCVLLLITTTICASYQYKSFYLKQQVDHFSFANSDTFMQRYLVNDSFWNKNGGPIFFYTGNEGDIDFFAQNTGFMWDNALEFKALLVFGEHRYYGKSLPYGNLSLTTPKYSGYLTSEQALADYAELITYLKVHLNGAESSPVIAIGGSYGGMLSAWFRMKYPHIVHGAIAASAPILQFQNMTPCSAFGRIVTSDYSSLSPQCADSVRRSWKAINDVTATDAGKQWLSSLWHLCKPLKTKDSVSTLKEWLADVWTNLAMLNYPYPSNFLAPIPGHPVKVVCTHLKNSSLPQKSLLQAVFSAVSVYFNYTGTAKCLNTQESDNIGSSAWNIQACTEMVMPMCYDGHNDFFEPANWDLDKYSKDCQKQWKLTPRPYMAPLIYGGQNITAASNIVFSNGLLDPWASGGVMKTLSPSLIAVIIPEGAHHLDLRATNKNDPASVIAARKIEKLNIKKWIAESRRKN